MWARWHIYESSRVQYAYYALARLAEEAKKKKKSCTQTCKLLSRINYTRFAICIIKLVSFPACGACMISEDCARVYILARRVLQDAK